MPEPDVSLIIPTRNRWSALVRTLEAMAAQTVLGRFEVIVADDGSDQPQPADLSGAAWPMPVRLLRLEHVGIGPAKNRAIAEARGRLLIFINDDTYPEPDIVEQHLAARADAAGHDWMHLGLTRWRDWPDANLFDRLIAESGMIFFYHDLQPQGLYNFRHAWNCNLSVDAEAVRQAGGFNEQLGPFFFEDLELAFRLEQRGWQVRYWPEAVTTHDHRYTPDAYLRREHLLGRMAVWLWRANPQCFEAVYGARLDREYVAYCRKFVADQQHEAERMAEQFRSWDRLPMDALTSWPAGGSAMIELLVAGHRVLKRWTFRCGLLEEVARSGAHLGGGAARRVRRRKLDAAIA